MGDLPRRPPSCGLFTLRRCRAADVRNSRCLPGLPLPPTRPCTLSYSAPSMVTHRHACKGLALNANAGSIPPSCRYSLAVLGSDPRHRLVGRLRSCGGCQLPYDVLPRGQKAGAGFDRALTSFPHLLALLLLWRRVIVRRVEVGKDKPGSSSPHFDFHKIPGGWRQQSGLRPRVRSRTKVVEARTSHAHRRFPDDRTACGRTLEL